MIARNCDKCQEKYLAVPSYLNRGEGIYCSRECAIDASRKKRIYHENNVKCAICGTGFYKKPSSLRSKSGLYFCSRVHQAEAKIKGMITSGPPRTPNHKPTEQECKFCLNMIINSRVRDYHIRCEKLYRWLEGDNSVTLSVSSSGYPRETKSFVKKYLIKIRGDGCEKCGFNELRDDGTSIIQMDHINGNCFDNNPANLRLLCPNCHAKTDTYGSRNKGSGRAHRRKQ